jgi:hypothetical protein
LDVALKVAGSLLAGRGISRSQENAKSFRKELTDDLVANAFICTCYQDTLLVAHWLKIRRGASGRQPSGSGVVSW